ncbi:hypothetical protein [Dysgonomonas termitidis]|uniref:Uncharacterized protein n=1 Tax=Dysgonomonas termitidis TaxID=1516126 RepID=A0ABV9L4D2_9BACT
MFTKYRLGFSTKFAGQPAPEAFYLISVKFVKADKRFVFDRIVIGLGKVRQSYCYIKTAFTGLTTGQNLLHIPLWIRLPTTRHGPGKTTYFQCDTILHKLCDTTGVRDGFINLSPDFWGWRLAGIVSDPFYY